MDKIEILKNNLQTICEEVLTCDLKRNQLNIYLLGISENEEPQIDLFVDEYSEGSTYTWLHKEFNNSKFKSVCKVL